MHYLIKAWLVFAALNFIVVWFSSTYRVSDAVGTILDVTLAFVIAWGFERG